MPQGAERTLEDSYYNKEGHPWLLAVGSTVARMAPFMGGRGCKRCGPRGVLEAVELERSAGPRLLKAQPSPNYSACVLLKLFAIDRYLDTLSDTNLDIMKLCLEPKLRRGRPRCSWAARLAAGSRLVWRRGRDPGPDPSHVPWDGDTANLKARAAQRSSCPFIHMRRATRMRPVQYCSQLARLGARSWCRISV